MGLRVPGHPVCTQTRRMNRPGLFWVVEPECKLINIVYTHSKYKSWEWELELKLELELLCTQKGRLLLVIKKKASEWPQVSNQEATRDPFTLWPRILMFVFCFLFKHCYQNGRERFGPRHVIIWISNLFFICSLVHLYIFRQQRLSAGQTGIWFGFLLFFGLQVFCTNRNYFFDSLSN